MLMALLQKREAKFETCGYIKDGKHMLCLDIYSGGGKDKSPPAKMHILISNLR